MDFVQTGNTCVAQGGDFSKTVAILAESVCTCVVFVLRRGLGCDCGRQFVLFERMVHRISSCEYAAEGQRRDWGHRGCRFVLHEHLSYSSCYTDAWCEPPNDTDQFGHVEAT